jgi:hypothetical protein
MCRARQQNEPRPSFRCLRRVLAAGMNRGASTSVSAGERFARPVGVRHQGHRFRTARAQFGQR